MNTQEKSRSTRLNDGLRLSYHEYGDSAGKPLLYFSGGTASGQIGRMIDPIATQAGVRVLAPNLPGTGSSNFKPGRSTGKKTPIPRSQWPGMQPAIPNSQTTFIPGEGHVSMMHNHGPKILEGL
ncbi:MAG: hypothetical protein JXA13_10050 [Anaerolineales bacterium]|nr:hypothetical protein [Anaerolineales bacterium]